MSLDREIALLTSSDKRSNALLALPVLRRLAISLLSTATVVAVAHTAAADPRSPAPGDTGPIPPTAVVVTPPAASAQPATPEDAHIQELVDREVARILAERAAADAAQKEADDKARAAPRVASAHRPTNRARRASTAITPRAAAASWTVASTSR